MADPSSYPCFHGAVVHFIGRFTQRPGELCRQVEDLGGRGARRFGPHVNVLVVGEGVEDRAIINNARSSNEQILIVNTDFLKAAIHLGDWKELNPLDFEPPMVLNNEEEEDEEEESPIDEEEIEMSCPDKPQPAVQNVENIASKENTEMKKDDRVLLRDFLESIHCSQFLDVFEREQVDIGALRLLELEDWQLLGIPLGPRRKIQHALSQLDDFSSKAKDTPSCGDTKDSDDVESSSPKVQTYTGANLRQRPNSSTLDEKSPNKRLQTSPSSTHSCEKQDLADGEEVEVRGSRSTVYLIKNLGGVYSCSCPAWRNQSKKIDVRTCKHIQKLRGMHAEADRLGVVSPPRPSTSSRSSTVKTSSSLPSSSPCSVAPPAVMLALAWKPDDEDYSGWWMSEKLDGVRAWWDGSFFWSRQGNRYDAPQWFSQSLPKDIELDGELWMGRKKFQQCVSIVRRQNADKEWESIRYCVFDAPKMQGSFEMRQTFLANRFSCSDGEVLNPPVDLMFGHDVSSSSFPLILLPQKKCCGNADVLKVLEDVQELGGEGVMLRAPGSDYESGRSSHLLKVKAFHDDEAIVLEHNEGRGRNSGRLGAVVVRNRRGKEFKVGTGFSDAERDSPPPIGTVITYRYQELTQSGKPRFPSFVRIRPDVDSSEF